MALKNYAYYDVSTGVIENVLLLDTETLGSLIDFPLPGFAIKELPKLAGEWSVCGIGWIVTGDMFVEPPRPEVVLAANQPTTTGTQTL